MATKTVDIGDGVKRPIWFAMSFSDVLKEKYGSFDAMLKDADLADLLPQLVYEGLVNKEDLTPESIKAKMDSSMRFPIMSDIWHALTGIRVDFLGTRQAAYDDLAKNINPPAAQ